MSGGKRQRRNRPRTRPRETHRRRLIQVVETLTGLLASRLSSELINPLAKAAIGRGPILLIGPTGSGKSFIAKAVHESIQPSPGPFYSVDCAIYRGLSKMGRTQIQQNAMQIASGGTYVYENCDLASKECQVVLWAMVGAMATVLSPGFKGQLIYTTRISAPGTNQLLQNFRADPNIKTFELSPTAFQRTSGFFATAS